MNEPKLFEWIQFGILLVWGWIGLSRAVRFHLRGIKVIAMDRQRTPVDLLIDLTAAACLLLWGYQVTARAFGFGWPVGPEGFEYKWIQSNLLHACGVAIQCLALFLYQWGLRSLGKSWRLGVDRSSRGDLVTHGVFQWTRHPIYLAFDLIFIGTFLTIGRGALLLLALVWIPVMHSLMLREERFLYQTLGDAYKEYMQNVGRYFNGRRFRSRLGNAVEHVLTHRRIK